MEAQKKIHSQLINEMEELRNEAALEISLQRHSYEDEIASLTKVIEERNASNNLTLSSPCPMISSPESATWREIEALFQDTERRLALPRKTSPVKLN